MGVFIPQKSANTTERGCPHSLHTDPVVTHSPGRPGAHLCLCTHTEVGIHGIGTVPGMQEVLTKF